MGSDGDFAVRRSQGKNEVTLFDRQTGGHGDGCFCYSCQIKKNCIGHICICDTLRRQQTHNSKAYASAHSHTQLNVFNHTHITCPESIFSLRLFTSSSTSSSVLLSSFSHYLLQYRLPRMGCVWQCVFCPAFSQGNTALITESTQACLTALLLAPSSQLPATSHWGVYTLTHTHTYSLMQA